MKKPVFVFLSLLLWSINHLFGQQELIPRLALFAEDRVDRVDLSPDGQWISYRYFDGEQNALWLQSTRTDDAKVICDTFSQIALSGFLSDGRFFYIKKQSNLLFHYHPITQTTTSRVLPDSIQAGQILHHSPNRPDWIAVYLQIDERHLICRLNIQEAQIVEIENVAFSNYFFDGDLNPKAAVGNNEQGGQDFYVNRAGEWTVFRSYFWGEGYLMGMSLNQILSVSADGETLYFLDHLNSDRVKLQQASIADSTAKVLVESEVADLLAAGATLDHQGRPQAVVTYYGALQRHLLDQSLQADFDFLQSRLTGDISYVERSWDDCYWLIRQFDGGPAHYFLYDAKSRNLHKLVHAVPSLANTQLVSRRTSTYTSGDRTFPLQIYLPPDTDTNKNGQPQQPLPTVVYVHGGPWVGFLWNSWFTNRHLQLLANRGYAVLQIDYRGSLGYGKASLDASNKQWGQAMQADIFAACDWAIVKGISDPKRLAIFGWSYGGYASMQAVSTSKQPFRCGIALYGISDLNRFLRMPIGAQQLWKTRVGDAETADSIFLKQHSPFHQSDKIKVPLLMAHGGRDQLVPTEQMQDMATRLIEQDKPVTYLYFPEEGHDFRQADNWIAFWAVGEDFLARQLDGRHEVPGSDLSRGQYDVKFKTAGFPIN